MYKALLLFVPQLLLWTTPGSYEKVKLEDTYVIPFSWKHLHPKEVQYIPASIRTTNYSPPPSNTSCYQPEEGSDMHISVANLP